MNGCWKFAGTGIKNFRVGYSELESYLFSLTFTMINYLNCPMFNPLVLNNSQAR